jgi:hypothetical protein
LRAGHRDAIRIELETDMRRALKDLLKPYRAVVIDSDGDRYEHRAYTTADARDWLRCYGAGIGIIYSRSGRIVAVRVC